MDPCMSSRKKLTLAALALTVIGSSAEAQLRPFSIDDYLSLETAGGGSGQGDLIVWEQAPPYNKIGYYGHDHIGAWGRTGLELRTVDLAARDAVGRSLFKPEPGTSYWIDSLSPDARYVAFYAAKEGVFYMGSYDTQQKAVRKFNATPLVNWSQGRESVWISPEEFLFSSYEGDMQPLAAVRPYTGHQLVKRWDQAWKGGVSVSVETTGLEQNTGFNWKGGQLFKANARTGRLTLLSEGKFESLKISPDGRWLAALRQADLPPPDPKAPNIDWVQSRSQLTLFDLRKGGAGKPVVPQKLVFIETLSWAPDTNRLAFFAWNEGEGVQSGYFYALNADTGAVTSYPHKGLDLASERERGFAQKPERVMWIGERLAVLARKHAGDKPLLTYRDIGARGAGKADWFLLDAQAQFENLTAQFKAIAAVPLYADAKSIALLADGDVWRVGPGLTPKNLTDKIEPALSLTSAMRYSTLHRTFSGEAILVGDDAEKPGFALIDFTTDTAKLVDSPASSAQFVAGAVKSGAVLFRYEQENGTELILKHTDGRQRALTKLNAHMAGVAKTRWTTISYKVNSHLGEREVKGCLLLPVDYQAGKQYPVIVEIYPGRTGGSCTRPSVSIGYQPGPYSEHLLAAKGYVVLQPNTTSELIQTKAGPLGGMADMVEQGVKAVADQGYGDVERVGLLGLSQGGFSSLWLATQMKLFKATVSLNGWSDMYVHYFDASYIQDFYSQEYQFKGAAGRYEPVAGTDFPIGKKPYDDPLAYIKPSPLFNAPGVSAPIMLIHSDMDAFNVGEYERMFTALSLQGKKAKLLRYWGEGHSPSSPGNLRHMWGEIFQWFDEYVMKGGAK